MDNNLFLHKSYQKAYKIFITELYPVIRSIEVSEGTLTDLFVHIKYADFYNSNPQDFTRAVGWSMKNLNEYFGKPKPTITLRMDKGEEFVCGSFVEDDNYW